MNDKVIVIRESAWKSFALDAGSNVMMIAVIGLGVVLDSEAMQWIAGIMWVMWVICWGTTMADKSRMTTAEAIKYLQERETK